MVKSHDEPRAARGAPATRKRDLGEIMLLVHVVLIVAAIAIAVQVMS